MLALIEEVRSNNGRHDMQRRGGNGGRGARRSGIIKSTNATPPSSKMLARRRATRKHSGATPNSRSDADVLEKALAYSRAGAAAPSPARVSVRGLRKGVLGKGRRAREKVEIRATAAALLRRLIVEKQDKMRTHFHKIPFMPQLPDLPALGEVSAVLSEELGYQSLGAQLGRLTPLLKDESTQVIVFWRLIWPSRYYCCTIQSDNHFSTKHISMRYSFGNRSTTTGQQILGEAGGPEALGARGQERQT